MAAIADIHPEPVARCDQAILGNSGHPPVQAVEERTVHARRAVDELGGVDEMTGAALVHDHRRSGEVRCEVSHRAGVVEVDVRHDDPPQVRGSEPELCESRMNRGDTRLRTGLDERGHRTVDEESRGELVHATEQGVELTYPGGDLDRVAHCFSAQPMERGSGTLRPAARAMTAASADPSAPWPRRRRTACSCPPRAQPARRRCRSRAACRSRRSAAAATLSVSESALRPGSEWEVGDPEGDGDGVGGVVTPPGLLLRPGMDWSVFSSA